MKKLFLFLPLLALVACAGNPASQTPAERRAALAETAQRNLDAYAAEHGGKLVLRNANEATSMVKCGNDVCLK